jgi:hypothetical protein
MAKKNDALTEERKEKLRRLRDDFEFYAPRVLKIRTKMGELIPFKLNYMQLKINEEIERQKAAGKPVRIIVLKARQMGCSTFTEGRLFHKTTMSKLTNSMIIAHKEDASTNLFNMSKLFYECMPEPLQPMRKASNAKELIFENPTTNAKEKSSNPGLRSKIKIETASSSGAGRSDMIHNMHISELAFWPNASEVMTGVLQAVPMNPNTMIIVESTANGVGGYFYDMWQASKEGKNDFVPLFFAWFENPEYRMEVPEGFRLDAEERELKELYNLDDEQLVWRRWCINNNCGGDIDKFFQEYPSNDIEAFLSSGRPVFNTSTLNSMLQEAKKNPPKLIGNIVEEGGRVKFVKQEKGYLSIWKEPEDGREYLISADVAEGLAHGDYSVADVIDRKTMEQVAQWHGHIDPDVFGEELYKLARLYNMAFIVTEVNNHGLTTVTTLKKKYRKLYRRRTVDKISNKSRQEYGFQTNTKTKPLVIDFLAKCIRERTVKINCKETIEECLTYVRDDKGATNAQEGCYDDRVMALAIGLYANYEVPYTEVEDYEPEYEVAFGNTGY